MPRLSSKQKQILAVFEGTEKRSKKRKKSKSKWSVSRSTFGKNLSSATSPGPLAVTSPAKFIYSSAFTLNPSGSSVASIVLRANSPFDPEAAAGGGQPRGFDELMELYDHFVVKHAKVTLWCNNTGNQTSQMTIVVRDSLTAITSQEDIYESNDCAMILLAPAGTGGSTNMLSMTVDIGKFLGRKSVMSDPELKGSASANPVEQAFFHLHSAPINVTDDQGTIQCRFRIEYDTTLIEPRQPAKS